MNQKKFQHPGKKRFVNPLNKQVGRRTGRDFRAGKEIRVRSDGLENWDDYLSESDADSICLSDTRNLSDIKPANGKENATSRQMFQSAPALEKVSMMTSLKEESYTHSQSSQPSMLQNSKYAWLTNKNIGRRTGKDIRANKQIRVMENGLENFDDYLSEVSDAESFLSASSCRSNPKKKLSRLTIESKPTQETADDALEDEDDPEDRLGDDEATPTSSNKQSAANNVDATSGHIDENVSRTINEKSINVTNRRSKSKVSLGKTQDGSVHSLSLVGSKSKRTSDESAETGLPNDGGTQEKHPEDIDLMMEVYASGGEDVENQSSIHEDPDSVLDESDGNQGEESDTAPDDVNDVVKDDDENEDDLAVDDESNDKEDPQESQPTSNNTASEADHDDIDDGNSYCNDVDEVSNLNLTKSFKTYERTSKSTSSQKIKFSDKHKSDDQVNNQSSAEKGRKTSNILKTNSRDLNESDQINSLQKKVEKSESEAEGTDDPDSDEEVDPNTDQLDVSDTSEIGGSQALSGLDVAGNRSGSITKLNSSGSAVSFDRTKKRLSYSALEASEKAKKLIAKRVEMANLELARQELDTSEKSTSVERKSTAKDLISDKQENSMKNRENYYSVPENEDGNDFLCLTTRSIHVTLQGRHQTGKGEDSDTDISIIDDIKPHAKHRSFLSTKKTEVKGKKNGNDSVTQKGGVLKEIVSSMKVRNAKSGRKSQTKNLEDNVGATISELGNKSKTDDKKGGKMNRKLAKDMHDNIDADSEGSGDEVNKVESFVEDYVPEPEELVNESIIDAKQSASGEKGKYDTKDKSKRKQEGGSLKTVKRKLDVDRTSGDESSSKIRAKSRENDNVNTDVDFKETRPKKTSLNKEKSSSEESHGEKELDDVYSGKQKRTRAKKQAKTHSSESNVESEFELFSAKETAKERNKKQIKTKSNSTSSETRKSSTEDSNIESESDYVSAGKMKQTKNKKLNDKSSKTRKSSTEESNAELNSDIESQRKNKQAGNNKQKKTKSSIKEAKRKSSSEETDEEFKSQNQSLGEFCQTGSKKPVKLNSVNKRQNKRKSSSEENTDQDGSERHVTDPKKKKVSKLGLRKPSRKGSPLNTSPKSSSPVVEGVHTPQPDSTLVSTNLQSGISFRVGRRSELLENVTSGPLTQETIESDIRTNGSLTPCITKKGQPRRSKGRRVTICPEENTHHILSADEATFDDRQERVKLFRHSSGMSDVGTPLPSPSTTPVHIHECSSSETPITSMSKLPKGYDELPVEDRCIYPEPAPDGLRRSKRVRLKPVAWYKNEHIIWERSPDTGELVVQGVKPSMLGVYQKKEELKRKKRQLNLALKKASDGKEDKNSTKRLSIHVALPDDFSPVEKKDVTVINPDTQEEDGVECIAYRDQFKAVGPTGDSPKSTDAYRVTKLFEQPCMSVGTLELMPQAVKPDSRVTEKALVFRILKGKIIVKIHKTSALLEKDDTFFVPYGNVYSLVNMRNDKAQLYYTVNMFTDNDQSVQENNT